MKVDKYDVSTQSGALIWILVEHGTDINSVTLEDGYGIKGFVETFELDEGMLNYDVALSCMNKNGRYFGTTNAGCQIKGG